MRCTVAKCVFFKSYMRSIKYLNIVVVLLCIFTVFIMFPKNIFDLRENLTVEIPHIKIWTPVLQANIPTLTENRRIFFHEASGHGTLDFLQTCCIEAAAKHHPTRPVQVFLSGELVTDTKPWLDILRKYNNTEVFLLDNYKYFKGTYFEDWYVKGEWRKSPFKTAHMSDYLRINTIEKGGGLYMDLDLLTHHTFDEKVFRNFLVYEGEDYGVLANTIFHLEKGHPLIAEIIKVMVSEYDPKEYIFHGPEAITAAMYYLCRLQRGFPETNQCEDVKLFPFTLINPIISFFSNLYYTDVGLQKEWVLKVNKSYSAHLFSSVGHGELKKNLITEIKSKHLLGMLARENCPFSALEVSKFSPISPS